jgi:hypothetical protein
MAYVLFFAAAIATCLFWTAACVAVAARTERIWLRRLLVAAGVLLPLILLVPWVGLTGWLAFVVKTRTNWFAPTLTALLSAAIGGWWIYRAGMSRAASGAGCVAAAWPAFGLAALYLAAEAVTWGTLVSIDHDVAAQGRALRAEAAALMAASMPPAPAHDDDAAPLLQRVFAAIEADKAMPPGKSVVDDPLTADVTAADVTAFLTRHATTLDTLRRAADKPGCRFVRDWSRPMIDMLLPEIGNMRQAARLLAVAARQEAAGGDAAAALRDVVRIHRLGVHTAAEPIAVSGLVGQAIDSMAIETMASVLPSVGRQELPQLADPAFRDFLDSAVSFQRYFLGEEAWALGSLAYLQQQGRCVVDELSSDPGKSAPLVAPLAVMYRCFLWPADVAGLRRCMRPYHRLAGDLVGSGSGSLPFSEIAKQVRRVEDEIKGNREGFVGPMFAPALGGTFKSQCKSQALHRCAAVLVAATRFRVATGALPESAAALVPDHITAVPLDPFTAHTPLRVKRTDDGGLTVYSVGPDGEDDGGPPARGAERPQDNDDVGLHLAAPSDR